MVLNPDSLFVHTAAVRSVSVHDLPNNSNKHLRFNRCHSFDDGAYAASEECVHIPMREHADAMPLLTSSDRASLYSPPATVSTALNNINVVDDSRPSDDGARDALTHSSSSAFVADREVATFFQRRASAVFPRQQMSPHLAGDHFPATTSMPLPETASVDGTHVHLCQPVVSPAEMPGVSTIMHKERIFAHSAPQHSSVAHCAPAMMTVDQPAITSTHRTVPEDLKEYAQIMLELHNQKPPTVHRTSRDEEIALLTFMSQPARVDSIEDPVYLSNLLALARNWISRNGFLPNVRLNDSLVSLAQRAAARIESLHAKASSLSASSSPSTSPSDDGDDRDGELVIADSDQPEATPSQTSPSQRRRGRPPGVKNHQVKSDEEKARYADQRREGKRISKIQERARDKEAARILEAYESHAQHRKIPLRTHVSYLTLPTVEMIDLRVLRKMHKQAQILLAAKAPITQSWGFQYFAERIAATVASHPSASAHL